MAKELTYFKFMPSEWLSGDITLHDYSVQGVFTNVKALYWTRDCDMTLARLKHGLKDAHEQIKALIDSGIILHDEKTDRINIKFLDEQWDVLYEKHQNAVKNGSKGGQASVKRRLSNPQAKGLKQPSSIKIKNKIKNKMLFTESEIFDKRNFAAAFPNWPKEKLKYYWEAADRYSGEDHKYADWKKAISGWAAKDQAEGKIKFIEQTAVIPGQMIPGAA